MKKILFSAYSMDVGGIETALITLLKNIKDKYDITLVLEKKEGIFLSEVPENIKIIKYRPSTFKIVLIRKAINFIKQQIFKLRYKNKFDFSASFATYSYSSSFIARTVSENCALWVHNDYLNFYDGDVNKYKKFFEKVKVENFKKIIFVSENDKNNFIKQFENQKDKCIKCNNLIDYNKIIQKSKEPALGFEERENIVTFINLGRHKEPQKKLSRIISATKRLNEEGYIFRVLFIGDGEDSENYKKQAEKINNIEFLGAKKNPYPYLAKSDCLLMSSDYEGYPVVFIESMILGKPIITTEVSDSILDVKDKFGIVVEKSEDGVYSGMKEYLDKGFNMQKFDSKEYNDKILKKLDEVFFIWDSPL